MSMSSLEFEDISDSMLLESAQAALAALEARGITLPEASPGTVAVEASTFIEPQPIVLDPSGDEDIEPWSPAVQKIKAIRDRTEEAGKNNYTYVSGEHPRQGSWHNVNTIELASFETESIVFISGYTGGWVYNFRAELVDPKNGIARIITDPRKVSDKVKAEMEEWIERYPHNHSNPVLRELLQRHAQRFYFGETIQIRGNFGNTKPNLILKNDRRETIVRAFALDLEDWENMVKDVYNIH